MLCTFFSCVFITLKHRLQILSGVALFAGGHLFRGAGADDGAAAGTAFRAKVDQVIGNLNDIQIVLDDQNGIALIHQRLQYLHQTVNIRYMKARGGLIENIKVFPVETRLSSVASLTRWASPPDSVVEDWPSLM